MRGGTRVFRPALIATVALLASVTGSPSAHAEPCTAAAASCSEWVALGTGADRSLVYRTYSLEAKNEKITRALVVVHGAGRNADGYFRTAVAAAFLAGALDDTVVVAPRFASHDGRTCKDTLGAGEINWSCTGNSWRSGGTAAGNDALASFDLMDEILRKLAAKTIFPNVRFIVVAGHSAGGQYVSRYEMANRVHDTLGAPVAYVVSNPSSYAYLDPDRPLAGTGDVKPYADGRNCTTYDQWPYGLGDRSGYAARLTDDQLRKQLVARPVTYLLGDLDTLPLANFDASCPAAAQGPSRLARGQAFHAYVTQRYNAPHRLVVVRLCGHNARCMFTAESALPLLFPKP